jgi:hypothetical protein
MTGLACPGILKRLSLSAITLMIFGPPPPARDASPRTISPLSKTLHAMKKFLEIRIKSPPGRKGAFSSLCGALANWAT